MTVLDYQDPRLRPPRPGLRIGKRHLFIWLPLSLLAMASAAWACVEYNRVAGTDITPVGMARIAAAMNFGPFLGPLISGTGFREEFYRRMVPVPVVLLVIGWLPFLLVRRPVGRPVRVAAWALNLLAGFVWFASAGLSLGYYLS